jgi:hypothetical protein
MGSRTFLGIVLGILGTAVIACNAVAPDDEKVEGDNAYATQAEFDRNNVLSDSALRKSDSMSAADIQNFLEKNPWGGTSVLATYKEGGKTAAQLISDACTKYKINPMELLVRLQMEQSLIYKKTAPASTIEIAFGCGCPHSPACSSKYEGFGNQAECAAGTLSRSFDRALSSQGTVSGWKKGDEKMSEDKVAIVPANAATAALYTYTPWVGEAGGGKKGVGGASLHHTVWQRFNDFVADPTPPANGGSDQVRDNEEADAGGGRNGGGADEENNGGTTSSSGTSGSSQSSSGTSGTSSGTTSSGSTSGGSSGTSSSGTSGSNQSSTSGGTSSSGSSGTSSSSGGTSTSSGGTSGTNGSNADAGTRGDPGGTDSEGKIPTDGSEDDDILSEGNAPSSDGPIPPKSASRKEKEEKATEADLAPKKKAAEDGCSASGSSYPSSTTGLIGLAAAAALIASSRKKKKTTTTTTTDENQ